MSSSFKIYAGEQNQFSEYTTITSTTAVTNTSVDLQYNSVLSEWIAADNNNFI